MSIIFKTVFEIDKSKAIPEEEWGEINQGIDSLLPGHYSMFLCDAKRNPTLPQLKYLFGVVLKIISKETGIEPTDLYKIFEKKYAPKRVVTLNGEEMIVQDLKSGSAKDMGLVIEQIIGFVDVELNITIPTRSETKEEIAQSFYVEAYNDDWYAQEMKKRKK